jgi:hypothetical protein
MQQLCFEELVKLLLLLLRNFQMVKSVVTSYCANQLLAAA